MHPFEKSGLGKAPFRLVGHGTRIGPIRIPNPDGTTTEIGSPGQPMGSCKHCGMGIADCYVIRSSDGKEFEVGSSCVLKTDDPGLKKEVKRIRTKIDHDKTDKRITDAYALLEQDAGVRVVLESRKGTRSTMLDYVLWCKTGAGRSGKLKCARIIEATKKEVG